jgi:hypothetical protein
MHRSMRKVRHGHLMLAFGRPVRAALAGELIGRRHEALSRWQRLGPGTHLYGRLQVQERPGLIGAAATAPVFV